MARVVSQGGCVSTLLSAGWTGRSTPARPAHSAFDPSDAGPPRPVAVPGTVATAGEGSSPNDLHSLDHWYRLETTLPAESWLEFEGLATLAEIWIDGALVAESQSMFVPLRVPVSGGHCLTLCFRALRHVLARRLPGRRARWRGRLATEEGLRGIRTTLLGHMPGWSGDTPVIGPFRPIVLHEPVPAAPLVTHADLRTRIEPDGTGVIAIRLTGPGLSDWPGILTAGGRSAPLIAQAGDLQAELMIPDAPLWWPHTHGEPATLAVTAEVGGVRIDLGRTGFRSLQRHDSGGFGLVVNGTPIFCRGAIWTGLDPSARSSDPVALGASLRRARDAGFNMLRVAGMTVYETPEFFALCDELGLMVWHDFMFARFDYPDTDEFRAQVQAEARAFLSMAQAHPCLAVLCGGTEVAQSAAMSGGLPASWHIPLFEDVLAEAAAASRPDVLYVPHAPFSEPGEPPVAASSTVAHYFGIGAYQRPLEDLDSAGVRFAAECLALANLPDPAYCRANAKLAIPSDLGASWTYADTVDHYSGNLFGTAAVDVRRRDPGLAAARARATTTLLMQHALSVWRTDGCCAGALVLMWQDLVPGAGWGVVDSVGRPKSAWYALRSVCQPVQVLLRDRGLNGIILHIINETQISRRVRLALRGLTPDGAVDWLGDTLLDLRARSSRSITATALIGRWRDLANTWQFGPPAYIVLGVTLDDAETGERLSDATHFPAGPALARTQPHLVAHLRNQSEPWRLEVSTRGFAQFVEVDDDQYVSTDNYFHLWPGETRTVRLDPSRSNATPPAGTVEALNAHTSAHYGLAA